MARPSKKSPEEKRRVVLSVLRGEVSAAHAGRKADPPPNPKAEHAQALAHRVALVRSKQIIGDPVEPDDLGADPPCWAHLVDDDPADRAQPV